MRQIGVRDLKERTSDILRSVREEGQSYEITFRGRAIARVVPIVEPVERDSVEQFLDAWGRLSAAISAEWPDDISAVEAVREARRDL